MRKKAALVLGMAITFSQVAMAEEITSSTEQIENCTPETSVQEENFQETEQQSNVNEVQESVSEDEEVQTQESTIESSSNSFNKSTLGRNCRRFCCKSKKLNSSLYVGTSNASTSNTKLLSFSSISVHFYYWMVKYSFHW